MADLEKSVQLLCAGKFETTWATQFPFDQGDAAFQAMLRPEHGSIKAILQLNDGAAHANGRPR
jgi:hypothetical protein